MLCPLTYCDTKGASHLVCRGKSCAWWNDETEECAVLSNAKQRSGTKAARDAIADLPRDENGLPIHDMEATEYHGW